MHWAEEVEAEFREFQAGEVQEADTIQVYEIHWMDGEKVAVLK